MTTAVKTRGSVIIPAHNEESVIARTLEPLAPAARDGLLEVIVVCNGCTDRTAVVAKSFPGVHVSEIGQASKIAALNRGDSSAASWPRVYLDADIEAPVDSILAVLDELESSSPVLAARPQARYETSGADALVRSYYRARMRVPELHSALWGAGIYALNKAGHATIGGEFPTVTGDDLFVDAQFDQQQKAIVSTLAVVVRTPRRSSDLMRILQRNHRANSERLSAPARGLPPAAEWTATERSTIAGLARSIRGIQSLVDSAVFVLFAAGSRIASRGHGSRNIWQRDRSSRES